MLTWRQVGCPVVYRSRQKLPFILNLPFVFRHSSVCHIVIGLLIPGGTGGRGYGSCALFERHDEVTLGPVRPVGRATNRASGERAGRKPVAEAPGLDQPSAAGLNRGAGFGQDAPMVAADLGAEEQPHGGQ